MVDNAYELERLKQRIAALEASVKLGGVEFVLDDALLKQKPVRIVRRTKKVTKK